MANQDMKSANETYAGFISMTKVGIVITVLLTSLVLVLLA